jgi:4-aminobutyrate--pyruvate transaminase
MGGKMLARLRELESHQIVGNVRGLGLVAGVELVRDRESKALFDASAGGARKVMLAALEEGVVVRALARHSTSGLGVAS